MSITTDSIRNVAIAGHGATGKTTLVESILFTAGVIDKPELVENGKTVSDFTDEEISSGFSIHTSLSHLNWNDRKINVLDTPGSTDFVGEVIAAFRAAECTILTVGARAGVQIETIKLWRRLGQRNMPRLVFVNKMDEERAAFESAVADMSSKFDMTFVPVTLPIGEGADFRGIVNLIEMKAYLIGADGKEQVTDIPAEMQAAVDIAHEVLIGAAAEGDEELEMKYLEEETLSLDEVRHGIAAGLKANKLVPVLCGSALRAMGVRTLLDFIANNAPSPQGATETVVDGDGERTVEITQDASFSALVWKTSIDQFSGKLSYIKTMTGVLSHETELYNVREQKKDRVSKLYTTTGKKLDEIGEIVAGDIGVMSKVTTAQTNDTYATHDAPVEYRPLQLPQPVHSVAFEATNRKDEDKLAQMIGRAAEEDKTFVVRYNPQTKETVASGMGELHLNMILDRIKETQKIEISTRIPKVAYRETITKGADAEYTHKKQSGGHGQYGRVVIKIKPLERGQQYSFENMIKGMAVSKGYIPGIEKGLHEAMEAGVLAGYPVVDVGTELMDGKEHPVDSSEMAFKLAARGALREAMGKAGPVLLEPVMNLNVFIEDEYLGDVLGDLSGRRGRVLGQEPLGGGIIEIRAQVPQAELLRYSIDLRSITSGTGGFELEFDHYSPISGKIADDVIAAAKAAEHEE
ncbi:MAG: elongation factor G [Spirochaetaceae bacterium]|nr:MAG: elongation factor G [Spirochaetaceae bacterium]